VPTATVLLQSVIEMRSAALYATLILALTVVPVWLVGGLTGSLLQPLAVSYGVAMLASMLVALLVTPALSLFLLARSPLARPGEPLLIRSLQRGYGWALRPVLRAPRYALMALSLLAVIGIALIPFIHQSLVPTFREPDLLVHLDGAPGTSRSEMDRIVSRMGDELRTIPGVRSVGAHVGRALLSDRVVNVNASELWVGIDPAAPYDATVAAVRRTVDGYPGLRHDVRTYLQDRTSSAAAGDGGALTVRVFGENQAILRRAAEDVRRELTGIDGLVAARVDLPTEQPTLDIEVDLQSAQRHGLKPGDVRRAAATLLSGIQAGSLFEDQKVFDVVVWGTPETRSSLNSIRDLLLDTPGGDHVRLGEVAQVRVAPALSVIRHADVHSYLDIRLDVSGRSLEAVAGDVQRRIQSMQLPLEYHAEVVGDYAAQQAVRTRVLGAAAAAALGILLVLQAALGSWRLAIVGLILLPSALVGGLIAAFTSGTALTLGALAGLLAVYGIATRNLILLVRHYQRLQHEEGLAFGPELIVRGARERMAPVLITAISTGLALVPLLAAGDAAGFEVARPLAIVAAASLVTATLLQLFVTPAAYLLLAPRLVVAEAPVPARSSPLPAGGIAAD
jgi:Cu/Ag efflux pump CusA